jgi:type 1 glutamine amidotransferase
MARTLLALLATAALVSAAPAQDPRIELLLVTGCHRHDWVNTTPVMVRFLEATGKFKVTVTEDPRKDLTPANLEKYGVLVFHYRENAQPQKVTILDENGQKTDKVREVPAQPGRWPEANEKALLGAIESGKGLVVIHYATSAFDDGAANWPEFEKLIGGGWRVSKKAFGHSAKMFQFKVKITEPEHPITQGFPPEFLHSKDELYHKSLMVEGNKVLFTGFDDPRLGDEKCTGKDENLGWVREHGKGRVFTTVLGHGPDQMRLSPGFQALVSRGAEWAATGKVTIPVPAKIDAEPAK